MNSDLGTNGGNMTSLPGNLNPNWGGGKSSNRGHVVVKAPPGHPRTDNRGYVREHILVVEQAIGHYLLPLHVVHHADEDKTNNRSNNLVVCEDESYHQTLHARKRALEECGNVHWRKCCFCHQYDDPTNMRYSTGSRHYVHRPCELDYERRRRGVN
jgi:hypothetical protein